jgi:hemolysin activation/secretion protein
VSEDADEAMLKAIFKAIAATALSCAAPLAAQSPLDRADPSVIEEELRRPERPAPAAKPPLVVDTASRPAPAAAQGVTVGAIRIDGATMLPQSAFAPVIERYAGRRLSPAELQSLAGEVADVARAAGFGLATAWVAQQRVSNGILRVTLDEGRIDEIRAEGSAAEVVNRMLAPLADGRPVRTARLERQLLLAADLPGVRVGQARVDRRGGRTLLRLRAERDRLQGRALLDNWGPSSVGPVRAHLSGDLNGVFSDDDQLTVGGVMTALDPEEFGLIRAGYSKMLGRGGTEAGVYGYLAGSRPGGFDDRVDGGSREASALLSHAFHRSRASGLTADLEFTLRRATQNFRGARLRDDRLATLTASAQAFAKLGEGRGRLRAALVQGLDLFDATLEGDPRASRPDGSAVFTKLEVSGAYDRPLGQRVSMSVQAEGQIASRALLASEEMGLGGRYFLRGYDYRELSGDTGFAASVELRFDLASPPRPVRAAQIYGYADAGAVDDRGRGIGGGSLASAGGGIRFWLRDAEGSIELGIPIGGSDRRRDPRLSFTLGTRF